MDEDDLELYTTDLYQATDLEAELDPEHLNAVDDADRTADRLGDHRQSIVCPRCLLLHTGKHIGDHHHPEDQRMLPNSFRHNGSS